MQGSVWLVVDERELASSDNASGEAITSDFMSSDTAEGREGLDAWLAARGLPPVEEEDFGGSGSESGSDHHDRGEVPDHESDLEVEVEEVEDAGEEGAAAAGAAADAAAAAVAEAAAVDPDVVAAAAAAAAALPPSSRCSSSEQRRSGDRRSGDRRPGERRTGERRRSLQHSGSGWGSGGGSSSGGRPALINWSFSSIASSEGPVGRQLWIVMELCDMGCLQVRSG